VFVVEALQVDLVEVDVWADEVEDFGGAVTVGDVAADEAAGADLLEDFYGPFAGDERFVVGGDDDGRAVFEGELGELFRRAEPREADGLVVAERLGGDPVLAVAAVVVAAEHAEGEGVAGGEGVVEGFFLDGVDLRPATYPPGTRSSPFH
jgi:hypothetical protein